jgi:hypothetical protein
MNVRTLCRGAAKNLTYLPGGHSSIFHWAENLLNFIYDQTRAGCCAFVRERDEYRGDLKGFRICLIIDPNNRRIQWKQWGREMDDTLFPEHPHPVEPRTRFRLRAPPRRSDSAGILREPEVEARVQKRILEYMARRGWRSHRLHAGRFKTLDGRLFWGEEEGTPDRLFVRSRPAGILYLELKATGETPRPEQLQALADLRLLGYAATWVDSVESLDAWYRGQDFTLPARAA